MVEPRALRGRTRTCIELGSSTCVRCIRFEALQHGFCFDCKIDCRFFSVGLSLANDALCMRNVSSGWEFSARLHDDALIDRPTCLLYAYERDCSYRFEPCSCLATYCRWRITMVWLNFSACLLDYGWCADVVKFLTSKYQQTTVKSLLMNCGP